ncbi:MAG: tRNA epoxyqueuosine(34) reductase QueG [Candidatus Thermofonsia Clade 1 bacterium]|uniref:tRNA epoxyqueuosine(34) reductase QueG n=1 Tax=Candidatus Thermofonsia Clade 1 bacterium TaxID=2364210 RepID=A0A2M8PZK8_9CHLR|nr:MAG: tRNA epoxyqueuosine(34) reductase QueG [Candidatus Thermofonsia Clade 1 bacterium]
MEAAFESVRLKERAQQLGFSMLGVTRALPSPRLEAYLRWIAAGYHGTMAYMARADRVARRRDLNVILPNVRSLIVVGLAYHTLNVPAAVLRDPTRGRIAAYAWGLDYHEVIAARLEALAAWLRAESGGMAYRVYVDTGAILERSHAQQAGLGFIGKNTVLIDPKRGSFFLLGELLTDLAFDRYDEPHRETMCGTCVRCQSACPTAAFPQPYVLDARRCISYLTIEYKGYVPRGLRPLLGNWIMGCDICMDVCPFTRFATPTPEPAFQLRDIERAAPRLARLLSLSAAEFAAFFAGSPILRLKHERLLRNACIAAGNSGDASLLPHLHALLESASPLVRAHAAWAVARLAGRAAREALQAALARETDAECATEIETTLADLDAGSL